MRVASRLRARDGPGNGSGRFLFGGRAPPPWRWRRPDPRWWPSGSAGRSCATSRSTSPGASSVSGARSGRLGKEVVSCGASIRSARVTVSPAKYGWSPSRRESTANTWRALGMAASMAASSGVSPQSRPDHALETDDIAHALEDVPVRDVDHLVHQPRGLGPGGCEGRRRQDTVEITQHRLGLVEAEIAVIEHRDAAERMTLHVRRGFQAGWRDRLHNVRRALLLPSVARTGAAKRAAGDGVDDEFAHGVDLLRLDRTSA